MAACKDCKNFQPKDELEGYCLASESKMVDADHNVEDCIAGAFELKKSDEDPI